MAKDTRHPVMRRESPAMAPSAPLCDAACLDSLGCRC